MIQPWQDSRSPILASLILPVVTGNMIIRMWVSWPMTFLVTRFVTTKSQKPLMGFWGSTVRIIVPGMATFQPPFEGNDLGRGAGNWEAGALFDIKGGGPRSDFDLDLIDNLVRNNGRGIDVRAKNFNSATLDVVDSTFKKNDHEGLNVDISNGFGHHGGGMGNTASFSGQGGPGGRRNNDYEVNLYDSVFKQNGYDGARISLQDASGDDGRDLEVYVDNSTFNNNKGSGLAVSLTIKPPHNRVRNPEAQNSMRGPGGPRGGLGDLGITVWDSKFNNNAGNGAEFNTDYIVEEDDGKRGPTGGLTQAARGHHQQSQVGDSYIHLNNSVFNHNDQNGVEADMNASVQIQGNRKPPLRPNGADGTQPGNGFR